LQKELLLAGNEPRIFLLFYFTLSPTQRYVYLFNLLNTYVSDSKVFFIDIFMPCIFRVLILSIPTIGIIMSKILVAWSGKTSQQKEEKMFGSKKCLSKCKKPKTIT
jgi:hypothetical protein